MHVKQELFESGHATHFPLGLSISTTKHPHSSAKICNWKECNISVLCRHPAALKPYGTDPVPLMALTSRGYMIKKFFFGEAPPEVYLPTLFWIPFLREKLPLWIYLLWGTRFPFHIPSLELFSLFNCWKCTVFKIWINHKTRTFCRLFHSHKMHLSDRNDLLPFHIQ